MSALYAPNEIPSFQSTSSTLTTLTSFLVERSRPVANVATNSTRRGRFAAALERAVLEREQIAPEPFRIQELWSPLGIFLLSRLYVLCMFLAVGRVLNQTLTNLLTLWDSNWYLNIAQFGYVTSIPPGSGDPAQCNLGFFPLWPLVIRATHFVTGLSWETSGIAATFLTGSAASVAVWLFLRDRGSLSEARRGLSLVLFTPGALVLSFVYSEGLIVTLAALTLLGLRHRQWFWAGLAAALCSTVDPVGGAAAVTVVTISLAAAWREHSWRPLIGTVTAPLGILAFFSYLAVHAGSFFAWFHAQRAGWQGGSYFLGAPKAIYSFAAHGFSNLNPPVKTLSIVLAIVMLVLFARLKPAREVVVYVATVLVMGLVSPIIGITPRLLLRDAPLLATVGSRLNRRWFGVLLATCCALLGFLIIVSTTVFWTP